MFGLSGPNNSNIQQDYIKNNTSVGLQHCPCAITVKFYAMKLITYRRDINLHLQFYFLAKKCMHTKCVNIHCKENVGYPSYNK